MKHFTLLISIVWLSFLLGSATLAQEAVAVWSPPLSERALVQNETQIALKQVFDRLQQQYDIFLNYEIEVVANRKVSAKYLTSNGAHQNLERRLEQLLAPLDLKYEKLKPGYYVIYQPQKDIIPRIEKEEIHSDSEGKKRDNSLSRLARQSIVQGRLVEQTISGKVYDSENNEPLPGVNILAKGTTVGTVTDIDGAYRLTAPDEVSTLVFSSIGYTTQEVAINGRSELNVTLSADVQSLSEVVVVGYGTVRKSDLTGSVASVDGEAIREMPLTSLDQGLQGQAAGVQVVQASGQPGAVATVRIRGGNSLQGGNEPLYVIDGFPIYNGNGIANARGQNQGNNANNGPEVNPLAMLNPSDIESMEILKDASATAIYGSRGANGVVLITTKSGKRGKDQISFETYYGVQEVRKTIDVMNATQFAEMANEAYTNDGLDPIFSQEEIASLGEGTNWQDEIFRTAPIQNYQLTFSGGDEKTTYSVSGGYFSQDGIITNSYFTRLSARANLSRKINEKLTMGTHLTVNRGKSNVLQTSTDGGGNTGVVLGAIMMSPTLGIYEDEAQTRYTQTNSGILLPNPVATAREIDNISTTTRFLGDIYGEYEIIEGLTAKVSLGADILANKGDYYEPSFIYQGSGNGGRGRVSYLQSTTWLNENTLSYNKQLNEDHSINLLAGITFQGNRTEFVSASSQGFVTDALEQSNLQSGAIYNQPNTRTPEWGLLSYLGRVNYNLMGKYLFTFTGRLDGSSRFGEGNKYGFFPSGAIAWRAAEENFIQDLGVFDDLKLRASYGITGNQEIGLYNSLATLASNNYVFGGNLVTGFRPNRVPNPALQWERTAQFDVGLDMGFVQNRFRVTADYYHKKTTNLLFSANIPWTSGFNDALQNIGSVQNQGVELTLGADILTGPLIWTSSFNIAFNRNKVLDLGEVDFFFAGGSSGHLKVNNVSKVAVGEPIGSFFGYLSDGIFQNEGEVASSAQPNAQPGDRRYRDLNNDGQITAEGDRTIIGLAQPDFFGGWTNNFQWNGFELNVFTQWNYGNDILNYNRFELELPTGGQNISADMVNRWTPQNPSTEFPRATRQRAILFSDRQLEDGSFLRIKTLTFAYNFPGLQSERIGGLRLYFTAQNLLTFTEYTGFDPEVSRYGATNLNLGEDYGVYPVAKTYMLGLSLTLN
ncbi:SusC/RagA family TonB-linked outer membrane protein [Tunicatimonas pelagia]|uniref:SusC/RagA family TonB-linked outer membrane protein n=1 Tax=Tunicatimonas pelagia TaxID=931531 RepID=UPI0026654ABB|nr:TonB-dependent receptor [Tunicatimonas pelagia]WKN44701.1 TonB-dependent receptor [Tunicatimonas pelagia]